MFPFCFIRRRWSGQVANNLSPTRRVGVPLSLLSRYDHAALHPQHPLVVPRFSFEKVCCPYLNLLGICQSQVLQAPVFFTLTGPVFPWRISNWLTTTFRSRSRTNIKSCSNSKKIPIARMSLMVLLQSKVSLM